MLGKIRKALSRKLGPAPAWAWLTIAAGGVYWYRHRAAASTLAAGATGPGSSAGTSLGAGSTFDSGGGGGGGAQAPDIPSLDTGAPVSWDPLQQPAGVGTDSTSIATGPPGPAGPAGPAGPPGGGPAGGSSPGGAATRQNPFKNAGGYAAVLARLIAPGLNGPVVKPGSFGGLQWGGQVFRTQAKFMSYLSARGGALGTFAIQHPAAYTLFLTLPKGQTVTPATEARTRTGTGTHPAQPANRPSSVRGVPKRPHVADAPATPAHVSTRTPVKATRQAPAPKAHASASKTLTGKAAQSFYRAVGGFTPRVTPAPKRNAVQQALGAKPFPAATPFPAANRQLQSAAPTRVTAPAPTHVAPQPPPAAPTTVARQPVGRVAQARQNAAHIERSGY